MNEAQIEPRIVEGAMSPMTARNLRINGGAAATNGAGAAVYKVQVELPADGMVLPVLLSTDPIACDAGTHEHALKTARWLVNNLDKVPNTPGWDGVLAMAYTTIEKIGGGIK